MALMNWIYVLLGTFLVLGVIIVALLVQINGRLRPDDEED